MFENSLKIVDECGLTFLHVFPYSPRPGTPAEKMPAVEGQVIKRRAALLRAKGEARLENYLSGQIGEMRDILIETPMMGRTEHFAVAKFETAMMPGALIKAKVQAATPTHLQMGI